MSQKAEPAPSEATAARPSRYRRILFKISGEIIRTFNVTQSAVISTKGWTTVLASAVFLF